MAQSQAHSQAGALRLAKEMQGPHPACSVSVLFSLAAPQQGARSQGRTAYPKAEAGVGVWGTVAIRPPSPLGRVLAAWAVEAWCPARSVSWANQASAPASPLPGGWRCPALFRLLRCCSGSPLPAACLGLRGFIAFSGRQRCPEGVLAGQPPLLGLQ